MRINQNIAAMSAYRALANNQDGVAKSTERLASGLRINRAADDAAGLAISEGLRAQVGGLNQAQRNTVDGISLLRTADGGLNETHAILQRMRTLAVQAANSAVMSKDTLQAIQTEMTQLTADIDRIAYSMEFNGATLLDGSFRNKSLQVGANAGDVTLVTITSGITEAIPPTPAGIALWGVKDNFDGLSSPVTIQRAPTDGEPTDVSVELNPFPTNVTELVAALNNDPDFGAAFTAQVGHHNRTDGYVPDANVIITAKEPGQAQLTVDGIANNKVKTRAGSNEIPERVGGFGSIDILGHVDVTREPGSSTHTVQTGGPSEGFGTADDVGSPPGEVTYTTSWGAGASDAIAQIDRAIAIVSKGRAEIGATENGLEHTARSLGVSAENLTVAESRIRDADMAKEISRMQQWQILAQASMEMLAQANKVPETVLKLLQ